MNVWQRIWEGVRKAAVVLRILNDTGVVRVKETEQIGDAVDRLDDVVKGKEG